MSNPFHETQTHSLICQYTGIQVATVTCIRVAGHIPYLDQWKHTQAIHPLFSLELKPLLQFATNAWAHFCSLTPEETANESLTARQEKILQVTALALLHSIAEVQQSTTWLPTIQEVSSCWSSLLPLAHWKNYLESQRFRFPALRISKNNKAIDLQAYLQTCWQVKKDYETRVREAVELEKLAAAEAALVGIREDLVRKAPRSKKLLWRWFLAHIPSRYARDTEGWMWELFDAETEAEISEFTIADIDLFEEIVLCEIPTGTSISHAFLDRIAHKRKLLETKFTTFEILIPDAITKGKEDGTIAVEEPRPEMFQSRAQFLVAHARWKLANTDTSKHRRAAAEKQAEITVRASHVPTLELDEGEDGRSIPAVDVLTSLGFGRGDVADVSGDGEEE